MKATSPFSSRLFVITAWVIFSGCPAHVKNGPDVGIEPAFAVTREPFDEVMPALAPSTAEDLSEPSEPLTDDGLTPGELTEKLYREGLLGEVFFAFDRAELSPRARLRLEANARYMKSEPDVLLSIEGHCDERGTNAYNLALGHHRAAVARDYLIGLGISRQRLETISYGEERGVCYLSEESCWSRNRRAYFRVTTR